MQHRPVYRNRSEGRVAGEGTLDPNHTHYIFIDDGTEQWGADISFLTNLAEHISTHNVEKAQHTDAAAANEHGRPW